MEVDWDALAAFLTKWMVADWTSSVGTVVAIVALIVELRKGRTERKELATKQLEQQAVAEQQVREEQVRRVTGWVESSGAGKHRNFKPFVENASDMAIYEVSLSLRGIPNTVASKALPVVAPHTRTFADEWLMVLADGTHPELEVRFKDAKGIVWVRRGAAFRISQTARSMPTSPSASAPASAALQAQGTLRR